MGISILNDDLRESFENAIAIQTILEKELRHIEGNKSHLDKLVPDHLKGVYSKISEPHWDLNKGYWMMRIDQALYF